MIGKIWLRRGIYNGYTTIIEATMRTVVQKWGNSLGIRIPKPYVKELDLHNGSTVEITEDNGFIIIKPKKLILTDLFDQINEDNIHEEVDTVSSTGKEEW